MYSIKEQIEMKDKVAKYEDTERPVDSLVMRLRAMAQHEHDDLSIADEAADRIEAISAWQPIDTAPTKGWEREGGPEILGVDADGRMLVTWAMDIGDYDFIQGWYYPLGMEWEPTHWMPLPDAPANRR